MVGAEGANNGGGGGRGDEKIGVMEEEVGDDENQLQCRYNHKNPQYFPLTFYSFLGVYWEGKCNELGQKVTSV